MDRLLQNVRFALRMLAKERAVTLVALLTLGLGIGATTAIYSVVSAVLFAPLPYPQPERLVSVGGAFPGLGFDQAGLSEVEWAALREHPEVFDSVGVLHGWGPSLTLGEPERLIGAQVSPSLFSQLQVRYALGRGFAPEDERPGAPKVVILSDALWRRRFSADRAVLGRTVTLSGVPHTVVGVLQRGFTAPMDLSETTATEIFAPHTLDPSNMNPGRHNLTGVARLAPGATLETARALLSTTATRLATEYPSYYPPNSRFAFRARSFHEEVVGNARAPLLLLLGAVGFVLLIACANVANLLLSRAEVRQREMAVRTALGASRSQLFAQLLIESLCLSVAGALLGLLLCVWGLDALAWLIPTTLPRSNTIAVNGGVLLFAGGLALLTGVLFGLAPAWRLGQVDVHKALKEGGGVGFGQRQRLSRALIVAEVALALTLLVGAGLLLQSFMRLRGVPLGFNPRGILTFGLNLPEGRYTAPTASPRLAEQLQERLAAVPGVTQVTVASNLPLSGDTNDTVFHVQGRPYDTNFMTSTDLSAVTPSYFALMGIPLLKGRRLSEDDRMDAPPVVLVNQAFAELAFPGEDPLGKRIQLLDSAKSKNPYAEIVGVVGNVKNRALDVPTRQEVYLPLVQFTGTTHFPLKGLVVELRTDRSDGEVFPEVKDVLRELDPELPLPRVEGLEQVVGKLVAQPRLHLVLLGSFAFLALLLGVVGIYGVMSYWVTQRRREFGVRLALGAQQDHVVRMVVGQGMRLAGLGVGIGCALSLALSRLIGALLFNVSPRNPATFLSVVAVLGGAALLATYLPAFRASRVNPMESLRAD